MTPEELRAIQMKLLGSGQANIAAQAMSPQGTQARLAARQAMAEGGPPPQMPPPQTTQLGGPQEMPPGMPPGAGGQPVNPGMIAKIVQMLRMGKPTPPTGY